jgi:hypothetical protein
MREGQHPARLKEALAALAATSRERSCAKPHNLSTVPTPSHGLNPAHGRARSTSISPP